MVSRGVSELTLDQRLLLSTPNIYLKMVQCPICDKRGALMKHWHKFWVKHNTTHGKRIKTGVYEIHTVYKGAHKISEEDVQKLLEVGV